MSDKSIYDLDPHETLSINNGTDAVTRVPGGWIYERWRWVGPPQEYEPFSTVFVPLDNEFQALREDEDE